MANNVKLQDFRMDVKAQLNAATIAWLYETSSEIASRAKRNCSRGEEYSSQLRANYKNLVKDEKGEAYIGSTMEQAFWEEFGTGEHADTKKNGGKEGRKGWWVYKDGYTGKGGPVLTEAEAKAIEASSDGSVHATNGRVPNYTLEKAYTSYKEKAKLKLETILGENLGE